MKVFYLLFININIMCGHHFSKESGINDFIEYGEYQKLNYLRSYAFAMPLDCWNEIFSFLYPGLEVIDYGVLYNIILFFEVYILDRQFASNGRNIVINSDYFTGKCLFDSRDTRFSYESVCYINASNRYISCDSYFRVGLCSPCVEKSYPLHWRREVKKELAILQKYLENNFDVEAISEVQVDDIITSSEFFAYSSQHSIENSRSKSITYALDDFCSLKEVFLLVISRYKDKVDDRWKFSGFFPLFLKKIGYKNIILNEDYELILEEGSAKFNYLKKLYYILASMFLYEGIKGNSKQHFNLYILICYQLFKEVPILIQNLIN